MSNDRTSQLIGRLREAAEWLAEDIPEGTPEIEHLEGDVRLDELDLYCVWLMRQAADALSDPNPILAARVEEIEAARQSAEARVEALEKALEEIADLCPATQEVCLASTMGQIAIAALSSQGAEDGK